MDKTYKFKGKALFMFAGFICILTVLFAPFGVFFIYRAFTSKIVLKQDRMIYAMIGTKEIPYRNIKSMLLKKPQNPTYYVSGGASMASGAFINFATVVPLVVKYIDKNGKEKKVRLSSNMFENPEEILKTLEQKSRVKIELEKD